MKKHFELSLDHPALLGAKLGFNACLQRAIVRAMNTGSMEGTVTLKMKFEINEHTNSETGEISRIPDIDFKSQYSVPLKEDVEGTMTERCTLVQARDGYALVSNQISIEEFLGMEEDDTEDG